MEADGINLWRPGCVWMHTPGIVIARYDLIDSNDRADWVKFVLRGQQVHRSW
jgi:hypothetical protein